MGFLNAASTKAIVSFILMAAIALGAVGYYRAQAGPGYPLDDSWIHLAYARNLADGAGFGVNPDEPTPGATSPLWVVLLSVGFFLGAGHATWPWLLGGLCLAASAFLSARLVAALAGEAAGAVGPLLCGATVAVLPPLVWSAAGGMEVPLFTALVLATLLIYSRSGAASKRDAALWGTLAGLAALARPEGLLLAPLLAGIELVYRRARALKTVPSAAVPWALVYSPSVLFCLATSGRAFPNTFYAKTTALVAGFPDLGFMGGVVSFLASVSPVTLTAILLGLLILARSLWVRRDVRGALALAGFVLALPLAYAAMGRTYLFVGFAGNFGRYLYPILPPALVLGCWAVLEITRTAKQTWVRPIAFAAMLFGLGLTVSTAVQRVALYVRNVHDINSMQVAMAQELHDRFAPGDLVATNDVGALAYFTEFRVLDLIGIVSTTTLDALDGTAPRSSEREQALFALLERQQPAALVVFPEWYERTLHRLGRKAEVVRSLENKRNITSGGPRLVAYRIDWSTAPGGN